MGNKPSVYKREFYTKLNPILGIDSKVIGYGDEINTTEADILSCNDPTDKDEYLRVWIHISGKYHPKTFLDKYNYPYTIMQEINKITKSGINKGKISDTSFCYFEIKNPVKHNDKIKNAVELSLKIKNDARKEKIKIDYFHFTLAYSGIQGNMELSKDEIKCLRKLNTGISMHYFQNGE